jgi:hypothetical protein
MEGLKFYSTGLNLKKGLNLYLAGLAKSLLNRFEPQECPSFLDRLTLLVGLNVYWTGLSLGRI